MFGRWSYARISGVRRALDAGRLDEALQQFQAVRDCDDQALVRLRQELATALVGRARLRAAAGEIESALRDLSAVEALGRLDGDARLLHDRILAKQSAAAADHAQDRAAVERVARDLAAGRLDTAWAGLGQVPDPRARERLRQQVDQKQQRAAELAEDCRRALARGDVAAACQVWIEAVDRHGRNGAIDAVLGELAPACVNAVAAAVQTGRLDRLEALAPWLIRLRREAALLGEAVSLVDLVQACGTAWDAGDFAALREDLLRLRSARPEAAWIGGALQALGDLLSARDRLLTSPLGRMGRSAAGAIRTMSFARDGLSETTRSPLESAASAGGAPLTRPLLLLIDGTGSFLLLAGERITLGRASSTAAVHVALPADVLSHHADLVRRGEDYLVAGLGPTFVNQTPVSHAWLRDGDRVRLGERAAFVFCRPARISDTATLRLSARCRLPGDVGDVILFRETCLIGPQSSCHIRTREGDTRVVLFERGGELFVRRAGRDDRPTGAAQPLALRTPCTIGDLRLTITEYDARSSAAPA